MKDEEALAAMAAGNKAIQSNQTFLARLQRRDWITCDETTTLDSTDTVVLAFIGVTEAGEKILKGHSC